MERKKSKVSKSNKELMQKIDFAISLLHIHGLISDGERFKIGKKFLKRRELLEKEAKEKQVIKKKFDPNNQPVSKKTQTKKDWLWATYVPDRYVKFKIHGTKGHATAAIKAHSYSAGMLSASYEISSELRLYKRKNTESKWVEVKLKDFYADKESVIEGEK